MSPRRAVPADAQRLSALAQWVWLDTYAPDGVESRFLPYLFEHFSPAAFERLIADPARVLWVCEERGALQGLAQVNREAPAPVDAGADYPVELERLYVAPCSTGRGLGVTLLNAARATWPARALWLSVWEGNQGALRFYRREGGRVIGQAAFMLDGQAYPNQVLGWSAA